VSKRIFAVVSLVASCATSSPQATPTTTAPQSSTAPIVASATASVTPTPAKPTTSLTTIAGPGKRILIELSGFEASFRLVYVLQNDGTLVAWKPPRDRAPDWYTLRREIATHVVDFDGYRAAYEDGSMSEMRTNGSLVPMAGAPHAISIDYDLGRVRCIVDSTHALLCTNDIRNPVKATGITHARIVRAGREEACALLDGGDLACWNADGKTTVRAHDVVAFDVASDLGCAVTSAGDVTCWGRTPPSFALHDAIGVSLDRNAGCVFRRTDAPSCWGRPFPSTPTDIDWLRGAREVAIDRDLVCVLFADRSACRVD